MSDSNKKVNNPLFNNAVTGGTFEDFSQNALLLPAKDKTPSPPSSQVYNSGTETLPFEENLNNQESDIFSSFSNIVNLNPATGVLEQPPANISPIPLFPTQSNLTQTPPPQGPANAYRRTALKRPVYAQIPGLSNQQTPNLSNTPVLGLTQPTQFLQPEISPSVSPALQNQNLFTPVTNPQPFNPLPQSFFNPGPVMAAIPANEVMQPTIPVLPNEPETQPTTSNQIYRPVYHHWFYKKKVEGKELWEPFSMVDSLALENAFNSNDLDPDRVVATDGGRYDVNILRRERNPIYWNGNSSEVRRCSWFYKQNSTGKCVPYEENIATKLEEEYKTAFELNQWHRKVELPNGDTIVLHSPEALALFPPTPSPDAWGNTPTQMKPRVVKRGMDEFDIDEGEPAQVDHLLFLVHGIGSFCDLKFRTVEEVVDDFRSISLQLVRSHYKSSCERGLANRIEVLPISWHAQLHAGDHGIDNKLKSITLESIPRLRDFANDTILDVLFYSSPVYCQKIISTVGNELNRVYELFKQRNPDFDGGVSLGGHSLGSLILFDLLCHQHPNTEIDENILEEEELAIVKPPPSQRRMNKRISYMMAATGTGQPQINYPHLMFQPKTFFALGSPIGMYVTVRGLDNLGEQFALPTCPGFFNIFHPYDPVAYRVESLINPELAKLKPVLIPHHKGRKRMHLELKETMARVGADLKQRFVDSMKSTWNSLYQLAMFHRQDPVSIEAEVDKALQEQMLKEEEETEVNEEPEQTDLNLGLLNQNRRIDYVLQEAPFEFFNEYIFALTSHVCYWESEDTMLLILKEIYSGINITADDKIPQQTMTIERPPPSPKSARALQENNDLSGMDPTQPLQKNTSLGPPPMTGFVRKT